MIAHLPNILLLALSVIVHVSGAGAGAPSSSGLVSCGTKSLRYPFGNSIESPIRFNCSTAGIAKIGEFLVQEVTETSIYVGIPPVCNRTIGKIEQLFGENYAPSKNQNIILLQDCDKPLNSCVIRRNFIENRLNLSRCQSATNVSCFSSDGGVMADTISIDDIIKRSQCRIWFSSITSEWDGGNDSKVSLQFQQIKLVWWLKGGCGTVNCSENENCTEVKLSNDRVGHRCSCYDGYRGDGIAGGGCRIESNGISGPRRVIVIASAIAFGALLMLLIVMCFCLQKRSVSSRTFSIAKRFLCEVAGHSSVPFYTYKEIDKATCGFSDNNKLGTGAYGTVYAGKLTNGTWVAVKRLRRRDAKSIDQVVNEIKLLSSVNHPNLVRLLGCCIAQTEPILVYEFMPNGTLSQHLHREQGNAPLPWPVRLTIASQIANAIAHLHSSVYPPIYHRDIKSSNILLDHNFNSKISDFGLSRLGMTESDASHISTAPQGTPGYLDPQYHQDFQLSDKSDVYSFGVVLIEIISALKVIDFSRPFSEVNLAALAVDRLGHGRVEEIVDPYLLTKCDERSFVYVHNVAELAFRCLSFHRDMRPSMTEVAEELLRITDLYTELEATDSEIPNSQWPRHKSSMRENI